MVTIGAKRIGKIWAGIIENEDGKVSFTLTKRRKMHHEFIKTDFLEVADIQHIKECLDWFELFMSIRGELRLLMDS